ncbi:elymoclavine monooxygenase [Aspergillus leporis]|uniref:Elymoclavine monooxygenase n=1 Tax=Aspergillus leporis TaxID=41062 RepID=A0A5N5WU81_9EURO|nr:elymoclavine monooxygenase [Aspergillus leporis]
MGPNTTSAAIENLSIAVLTVLALPLSIAILQRLYFHPLARIPGPCLAAVTDFYAFYFNYVQEGGYSKRLKKLHAKYNSLVIRIGPNHVHIDSPAFFEEVFRVGSKYTKDPAFYKHFGGLDSMTDPQDYRTYRNHISSLYSARSTDSLAPSVLRELQIISTKLHGKIATNEPVNIQRVFRTLSSDIVLQILFSEDVNLSECVEYHPFLEALDTVMAKTWLSKSIAFYCEGWANNDQQAPRKGNQSGRDSHMKRYLEIDPSDEKKARAVPHPLEDIFNFIAGGSDTTAYSTTCAVHYLLTSPSALSKLQAELDDAAPYIRHNFDHRKIQSLPYLGAVVKEALRLSNPVPGCLPRIVPENGTRVGSVFIPPGTAVSVSLMSIQQNENIFRDPQKFIPERWLGKEGEATQRWNVAFSRGPRQCIGINIAYLELHTCLAYLFSHYEFSLSGRNSTELKWVDRFVSHNTEDVMVNVVRDRWT